MRYVIFARGVDCGAEKVRIFVRARARSRTGNDQQAVLHQQSLAGFVLQFAPDFMRPVRERRVLNPFAAGQPRDARVAVARAEYMRRRITIDAENFLAAFGELIERGRAHRAEADNHAVEFFAHPQPLKK